MKKGVLYIYRPDIENCPPAKNIWDVAEGDLCSQFSNAADIHVPSSGQRYLDKAIFRVYMASNLSQMMRYTTIVVFDVDTYMLVPKSIRSRCILFLYEVYDVIPRAKRFLSRNLIQAKKIVVPSIARSYIIAGLYQIDLKKISVLYNYPSIRPIKSGRRNFEKNNILRQKNDGRYILIYQGVIDEEKRPLRNLVDFVSKSSDMYLVIVGSNSDIYQCSNVYCLDFINPPNHLELLEVCDIGVMSYNFNSLNSHFAAPNKVWEYTRFGLPIISTFNYGLMEFNNQNKFIHFAESEEEYRAAFDLIKESYTSASRNSRNFFTAYTFSEELKHVLC